MMQRMQEAYEQLRNMEAKRKHKLKIEKRQKFLRNIMRKEDSEKLILV